MNAVDVLAVIGDARMETSQFAAKAGVSVPVGRRALQRAEQAGLVRGSLGDGRYWRRGAADPLIWQAITSTIERSENALS